MSHADEANRRHPIQVVSRRTGLSQDVIRVWERRYHAVTPERSQTNRRLYSDEDVQRLVLLRRATTGGRRIGDVAGLPTAELEELVRTDEEAAAPVPVVGIRASVGRSASDHLQACLQAVQSLDQEALERELARAAVSLTVPQLLEQLLMPLLRQIGEGWHDGSLRIAHEHMASAIVRSFLGSMRSNDEMPGARSRVVITTPVGQLHELGAMMAAVTAGLDGWQAIFLGANLPAEEIAAALLQREARVLALSIVHAADHAALAGELKKIRRLAPQETVIVVGGAAAHRYAAVLKEIGATLVGDLTQFRGELDRIQEAIA